MGNRAFVYRLPPEQRDAVDRLVREHNYADFDQLTGAVKACGVTASRSAVARYAVALRERDAARQSPIAQAFMQAVSALPEAPCGTVVVILGQEAAKSVVVVSELSPGAIVDLIPGERNGVGAM